MSLISDPSPPAGGSHLSLAVPSSGIGDSAGSAQEHHSAAIGAWQLIQNHIQGFWCLLAWHCCCIPTRNPHTGQGLSLSQLHGDTELQELLSTSHACRKSSGDPCVGIVSLQPSQPQVTAWKVLGLSRGVSDGSGGQCWCPPPSWDLRVLPYGFSPKGSSRPAAGSGPRSLPSQRGFSRNPAAIPRDSSRSWSRRVNSQGAALALSWWHRTGTAGVKWRWPQPAVFQGFFSCFGDLGSSLGKKEQSRTV